jgi:hypothetical protein
VILILLDTNAFQSNWAVKGNNLLMLSDLAWRGIVQVVVSEVTVRECARQFEKRLREFRDAGRQFAEAMGQEFSGANIPGEEYEKVLRSRLKEMHFHILPLPDVDHKHLVDRDLAHKKPFDQSGRGYRDALIWLSCLKQATDGTSKLIVVSANKKDFGGKDGCLHEDLSDEVRNISRDCEIYLCSSIDELSDKFLKPLLKESEKPRLEEQKAGRKKSSGPEPPKVSPALGTDDIRDALNDGSYPDFELKSEVERRLSDLSNIEVEGGINLPDGTPLEEPIYVTAFDDIESVTAIEVVELSEGFLCEGQAEASSSTIEGYLDKATAVIQSETGDLFISDPDWNSHMAEVEISGVKALVNFTFLFKPGDAEISDFEISSVTGDE